MRWAPERVSENPEEPERATVARPQNGPKRSAIKPLIGTVVVFAVLALLYYLGTEFLVSAD